ncbi:MAG: amidohydrolase [Lysobacteraceae bacterium]|nr:MAG: amidohydrolase [Xanthomonadaceae bacterium]
MNRLHVVLATGVVVLVASLLAMPTPSTPAQAPAHDLPSEFVVRDVRLFDGERFHARSSVHVRGGRIVAVGVLLPVPEGVVVVDGTGKTLLPGLIDAHVHTWGLARRDALRFGVTTQIDMFSDPGQLADARRARASVQSGAQADVWSAGTLATAPGGHGTQFGMAIPTLGAPGDAKAWVAGRVAEGSDFIKIVREDLHVYGSSRHLPSLDAATAAAVIDAAHAQGLLAVVHASAQEAARESLRDGADGLVHVFQDAPADAAFVALARERDAFVIPTLSVIAAFSGRSTALAQDPRVRSFISLEQREALAARMGFIEADPALLARARESVRRLHVAGVRLLAGTDAPNPGTAHGVSMHDEIVWLSEAGLGPVAALVAATSGPADAFGITDRGRIAPGQRADLLLVDGDPQVDPTATRAIVRIWKNGHEVDRRFQAGDAPSIAAGMISDFDGAQLESRIGSGWTGTSDRMVGGQSDARVERIQGGADATAGAMRVSGELQPGAAQVWAGAFFNPGDQIMQAVDASQATELVFQVRGDGRALNLLVFSGERGAAPYSRPVATTDAWAQVRLPLAGVPGIDAARLRAVAITASDPAGAFAFDLDSFEIR